MFQRIAPITKNLIIINLLFYLATFVFSSTNGIDLREYLGAFYPLSDNFRSFQILSHMFMHGDLTHLFFNMLALFMFGSTVEMVLGPKRYVILYFTSALGAYVLFNATNYLEAQQLIAAADLLPQQVALLSTLKPMMGIPGLETLSAIYSTPMVGASGAIFGVLIAFGMLFPNAVLMLIFPPIPIKAKYIIPLYVLLELVLAIQSNPGDNIAHYAHIGGAIIGFILIRNWKKTLPRWN
ncbi:rhomboid family intramembrane serine protease [Ornithobacterium rhinotracheale]|uniref:rhomboid family intramembrane serine protease n=1 Tax=Ornithobacterium rhinotracheale TaxID=28251 RepID=UPI00129C1B72|nr:rhomboid family intramembrane serine protease [Ornithobacterium rhinotracheale]MRJ11360.1 rhomboid family intramembrane serine protease [Ornithobacterium rhinotracheale]